MITQHYCGKDRVINPERKFVNGIVDMTNHVMRDLTGKGFRLNSLKRTGRGDDRRQDKRQDVALGVPKAFRQHATRYHGR